MKKILIYLTTAFYITLLTSCGSTSKTWTYNPSRSKEAIIDQGYAIPQRNLPAPVMNAIYAGNRICTLPYKFGGGHRTWEDSGYDCSGTVSYLLHSAGLIDSCGTSSSFRQYGSSGPGKYISIYAKKGHTFIEVAGLRMDTGYQRGHETGPRWTTRSRPISGYKVRHPSGF
jgi:hypothetical protein